MFADDFKGQELVIFVAGCLTTQLLGVLGFLVGLHLHFLVRNNGVQLSDIQARFYDGAILIGNNLHVVHRILDHLPVSVQNLETNSFSIGFPIGAKEGGQYVLYNHLSFLVKYHPTTTMVGAESKEVKRIVAFQVKPHR